MPYITMECGKLTTEQKRNLISRLTVTASEVTGIPQEFFMITIKELPDTNMGFGGKTVEMIKREYQKGGDV